MRRRNYLEALAGAGLLATAGCVEFVRDLGTGTTIDAPRAAMVDERLDVVVTDVDAEGPVWVEARTEDGAGHAWFGRSLFEPDDGRIELRDARPVQGTYEDPDGMGLFWSMQPADLDREFYATDQRTQAVTLRVLPDERDPSPLAEATLDRHVAAPECDERTVERPVVGTLVESPGDGPAPGVVLFHGSAGTRPVGVARVLASHGFTVLALQYVSPAHPELPDALVEVPVEYADRAVAWLADHDATTDDPVGLGGFSRGGELALLVGSRHENVGSVVNWVGAGLTFNAVVLEGGVAPSEDTPDTSAWTLDGEPLAHPSLDDFERGPDPTEAYRSWLEEQTPAEALRDAQVPLEAVDAAILLVSAGDDAVWPSRYLLDRVEQRLERLDYGHRFEHRTYDGAGHGIAVPYLPTWPNRPSGPFGGTMAGTAAAEADAWPRAVEYFELGASR